MSAPLLGGKYRLLRRLATGGMAEVFLACQLGLEGFEKLVVIKRVLPHLARDREFVSMFLEEARLSADLRHPNLVDVSEVGEDGGAYFMVMEFLHGPSLATIMRDAVESLRIPLGIALQIVCDVAEGLHYAHQKTDIRGQPLVLIHRDVSPQNVVVTYDGIARVIDFGIAKARESRPETPGKIRGKMAYMSPEQAMAQPLDARTDQFSVGVVLWEITMRQRLFKRESHEATREAVVRCAVPPPDSIIPDYPKRLGEIVLKALAREPENRFRDCEELRAALEEFLETERISHSRSRLSQFVRARFRQTRDEDTISLIRQVEAIAPEARPSDPTLIIPHEMASPAPAPVPIEDDGLELLWAVGEVALGSSRRRTGNVPPPASPIVGRDDDLAALASDAKGGHRLVTLIGPAGVGKTRLALEYAASRRDELEAAGGAWLVDVAAVTNADALCREIARVLETPLEAAGSEAVDAVARALAARGRALVVLDGFDHLVPAAAQTVGRWLDRAPEVQWIVTAREALRLADETVRDIAPLAADPGVRLFLQRSRAARGRDLAEIGRAAEVVRLLDGIPLAIEIAAARTKDLTIGQLLERLPEHPSLHDAVDWSWKLLTPVEQRALVHCAVFRGDFSMTAAESVIGTSADEPPLPQVLKTLREKSFLRTFVNAELPADLRLSLFAPVRTFAARKLAELGGGDSVRDRHAAWYVRNAERWAEDVDRHDGVEARARIAADMENLQAAFEWNLAAKRVEDAARAALAMDPVLAAHGAFRTQRALLDAALAAASNAGSEMRARLLCARGDAFRMRGMLHDAAADLVAALASTSRASRERIRVLCSLGIAEFVSGRLDEARGRYREALELARESGDAFWEGRLQCLAGIDEYVRARLDAARERYERALPLVRASGDRLFEGRTLGNLGIVRTEEGAFAEARELLESAIDVLRSLGERRLAGYYIGKLGTLEVEAGAKEDAARLLEQAVNVLHDAGDLRHQALFISIRGAMHAIAGDVAAAEEDFESADVLLRGVGDPLLAEALATHRAQLEIARARRATFHGETALAAIAREAAARRANDASEARSDEVRFALRLLRRSLADLGESTT